MHMRRFRNTNQEETGQPPARAERMAKMTLPAQRDPRATTDGGAKWGTVADAILESCTALERRALCVAGSERMGRLFVENQRVVHAEYGDESGLAALVEMLRAGRVRLSAWNGAWPPRRTLRLGPLALLAKGAVAGAPPPLPSELERSAAPDAANDFRSSGVFRRGAAGKPSELAPLPSQPNLALASERNQKSELPAALFTGALTELGLAD